MQTTTAWVVSELGSPPRMTDISIDPPGDGEVLIGVSATGLNFADLLMIGGQYQETPPLPFVPGMEVAGVIEDVGAGVTTLTAGDRVMAVPSHGGLAGTVRVPAQLVRPLPDAMDDVTAAGFQIAYGTSHLVLTRRAQLQQGETLLVLGAAGGVGLTAVEIGRELGARVVAVARGSDKLAVANSAGADVLIDSTAPDLIDAFRALGPVDVVYDAVGGQIGETALRVMAPEGRYLIIGFASGDLPRLKPNHLLVKNQTVIGFYWSGYRSFRPEALNDSLAELSAWHAAGHIRPHVSHVLPFEAVPDALDLLKSRKSTGKVVVTR